MPEESFSRSRRNVALRWKLFVFLESQSDSLFVWDIFKADFGKKDLCRPVMLPRQDPEVLHLAEQIVAGL